MDAWPQRKSPKRFEIRTSTFRLWSGPFILCPGLRSDLNRPSLGQLTPSIIYLLLFSSAFYHEPQYIQNENANSFSVLIWFQGSLNDIDRSDLFYPREQRYYNHTQMKYGHSDFIHSDFIITHRSDLFYPREQKYYNHTQMKYGFTRMRMLPEWTGTSIEEFFFSPLQLIRALSSLWHTLLALDAPLLKSMGPIH